MPQLVVIADDHPLFREALKLAVTQALPGAKIAEADSVASLFATLEAQLEVELLLLDLNMPGAQGFSALVQARAHYPTVPVIVISGREDANIVARTLAHGAAGFVPKSAPIAVIVEALRAVVQGSLWMPPGSQSGLMASGDGPALEQGEDDAAQKIAKLTPQQFRVLSMLCAGLLNKQIAAELGVTEATVKAHMTAIMEKLGASNRTQAVLLAQRLALDQTEVVSTFE
jgi:DNA-binding NarL/FixJ family response regulator